MTKLYRLFIFVGLFSLLSASVEAKSIPTNTDAKLTNQDRIVTTKKEVQDAIK